MIKLMRIIIVCFFIGLFSDFCNAQDYQFRLKRLDPSYYPEIYYACSEVSNSFHDNDTFNWDECVFIVGADLWEWDFGRYGGIDIYLHANIADLNPKFTEGDNAGYLYIDNKLFIIVRRAKYKPKLLEEPPLVLTMKEYNNNKEILRWVYFSRGGTTTHIYTLEGFQNYLDYRDCPLKYIPPFKIKMHDFNYLAPCVDE